MMSPRQVLRNLVYGQDAPSTTETDELQSLLLELDVVMTKDETETTIERLEHDERQLSG